MIECIFILMVVLGVWYLMHVVRDVFSKMRPADLAAITEFVALKELKVLSVVQSHNHWKYWLRGNLGLSSFARIFVVTVESSSGERHVLHVAFDPWNDSGIMVLR